MPLQITALRREQPVRSTAKEMMFSNTAMMVEAAAKIMNRKNREPQNRPPSMELNTLGRVTKIRLGPRRG